MLSLAGIDTNKFKAYSTRSASSSAASAGITTNQILEEANWGSKSVFLQFYYKPTSSNAVGVSVLSAAPTSSLLISDLSILKCNYLNGSNHRVVSSYSGFHEECEVNIPTSHPYPTLDM